MKKLPPLRAIQAFEAFGRHGSISATANELRVTSGAVSQQIKRAEEILGFRLLERHGNNVALTTFGRAYHQLITVAFDQLRQAQDEVEQMRAKSQLVVSCLTSLASKWIGPKLFDWQAANSGAQVRLFATGAEPRRGDEPIDFRITYGNQVSAFSYFAELFTDSVVPACSPQFLFNYRMSGPKDLLAGSLLSIEWDSEHQSPPSWADWARNIGEPPPRAPNDLRFSISSAAIDAAINGRGFVLAQLSMASDDIAAGRLVVPFDVRMKLAHPYFLAWERSALEKPFGAKLRSWIMEIAKRQIVVNTETFGDR